MKETNKTKRDKKRQIWRTGPVDSGGVLSWEKFYYVLASLEVRGCDLVMNLSIDRWFPDKYS